MPRDTQLRVMVVEDSTDFLASILTALALVSEIKVVSTTTSGEEALQKLAEAEPDLILIDYLLPGLNGIEIAKRIKTERPDVKIALVTAYAEELLSMESLPSLLRDAHVIDVIPKLGFNLQRIREVIKLIQ